MNQLAIPISGLNPSYAAEDFIVSGANELAYLHLQTWPTSGDEHAIWLHGPAGSGKTHLSAIWAASHQAQWHDADAIPAQPEATYMVLDHVTSNTDPEQLFHLLNHMKHGGKHLLITSRSLPKELGFTLADTNSRLNALPKLALDAPDDALLEALWFKLLSDRQLSVAPEVVHFLATRHTRDGHEIAESVRKLDETALAAKRALTIPFVKEVLNFN